MATRKRAPKKWVDKTAKTLRNLAEENGKHFSVESSKVAAKEIWKNGMKPACRKKAMKKYGKKV